MDSETLYALGGIAVFSLIAVMTLRSKTPEIIRSRTQKRDEIVSEYKKRIEVALASCGDDKEARIAEKKSQLKIFSDELSRNVFFDENDIKVIIFDLAQK